MSKREATAIDALAEKYFEETVAASPILLTQLGSEQRQDEYDDFTPAEAERRYQRNKKLLADLAALTPVDDVDAVTVSAINERIGLAAETHETYNDLMEINGISSGLAEIRSVYEMMPTDTAEQCETIVRRLHALPTAVEQWSARQLAGIESGHAPAARQVKLLIEQATGWTQQGAFFDTLAAAVAPKLTNEYRDKLAAGVANAKEAYRWAVKRLSDEILPLATPTDGVGEELYQLKSRDFLGTTIDVRAMYEWGKQQVAELDELQRETAAILRPGMSVTETKKSLDDDPKYQIVGTDNLLKWMQTTIAEALQALTGTHFDIPEPMQTLRPRIAPTTDGGIWYTSPSDDFARPGQMWWSVTPDAKSFGTWSELTTVYHEGVPGHHMQLAYAVYLKETLNSYRRFGAWTSGHGEGWALYAESLMSELGFLEDPGHRLGMLDAQAMRAARVVIDIGVHCGFEAPVEVGGGEWTFEKALAFYKNHCYMAEGQALFEVNRYFGWPGQAPAYKIGQKEWLELRAEMQRRQGATFNLKDFHMKALAVGGVGLDTLKFALLG
ncbi:MAG: DUF885 domain-containing protein [Propionibacteriaceae bacterium]|jgi:uncharacterized protein (DUF885 family)|nr:DUF885 domain-containing protein [Propionibacteriaceae bacterium]